MNKDGAAIYRAALSHSELDDLTILATQGKFLPGRRLYGNKLTRKLLGDGSSAQKIARSVLDNKAVAVRAILFDKGPSNNWSLGWHQDRTIAVKSRFEVRGFEIWSKKSNMHHVEPPFELFGSMLTVRLHLDTVHDDNAPLLIAPGSHKLGKIPVSDVEAVVATAGTLSCLAEAGDIWAYRTPILHASGSSRSNGPRRVLQADFCCQELPDGLNWLGI